MKEDRAPAPHTSPQTSHHMGDDEIDPRVHERRWIILGVLCMSLLIIVMDNTILNVAIPSLIIDLGATNSQVQWIIDSYVAGVRRPAAHDGQPVRPLRPQGRLQLGIVLFGLGSAAAAMSSTANGLIFTRAFMGIGGALIMPATLSILINVFRDPVERGRAIAIWAGLLRSRRRARTDHRRIPARALLVVVGVLGEPADRRDRPRRSVHFFVPDLPRPQPRQGSTRSVRCSRSSVSASLLFGIIEGPSRDGPTQWSSAAFTLAFLSLGASCSGSCTRRIRCST